MLEAVPRHWYSWHYDLMEGVTRLAEVRVSSWRDAGQLTVGQNTFRVYRKGLCKGAFLLESDGSILAQAEKPSVFRRSLDIQHQGRHYILKTASGLFGRRVVLLDGPMEVGSLTRTILGRRAKVNLPEELSPPLKGFVVWLAVVLWKRGGAATVATP